MRGKFCRRLICVLSVLLVCQLLFWLSTPSAYQIEVEYYDALTLDTVTAEGIYKRVILYLNASPAVLNKISSVTYHLDGDFYKPHLTVRSRQNAFQLELNTLTHIPVTVDVRFKDGKSTQLNQYILLGTKKRHRDKSHNIHLDHTIIKTPDKTKGETDYEIDLFLKGTDKDLAQLKYIEYHFSKPFPQRVAKVSSNVPQFKFQLKTTQQLEVQGYAYFKDGSVMELIRFLYFKYY